MTTTTDRAAELRAEIDGCNALIAYHTATGNSAAAGNFRARLKEYTDELRQLDESASASAASHMGRGSQKVSHGRCKSIQCATCYPRLGEAYNEAIRARREEGAES